MSEVNNPIAQSLFKNHLHLFTDKGDLKVQDTRRFMGLSLSQLAEAFQLSVDQVRGERMSSKVKEKLKELAGALEFVAETFGGDERKTKFWLKTPNPNFGGATPRDLIIRGRYQKVLQFILAAKRNY